MWYGRLGAACLCAHVPWALAERSRTGISTNGVDGVLSGSAPDGYAPGLMRLSSDEEEVHLGVDVAQLEPLRRAGAGCSWNSSSTVALTLRHVAGGALEVEASACDASEVCAASSGLSRWFAGQLARLRGLGVDETCEAVVALARALVAAGAPHGAPATATLREPCARCLREAARSAGGACSSASCRECVGERRRAARARGAALAPARRARRGASVGDRRLRIQMLLHAGAIGLGSVTLLTHVLDPRTGLFVDSAVIVFNLAVLVLGVAMGTCVEVDIA